MFTFSGVLHIYVESEFCVIFFDKLRMTDSKTKNEIRTMKTLVNIMLAIVLSGITILWGHQCVKGGEDSLEMGEAVDWSEAESESIGIVMQCEQDLWLDTMGMEPRNATMRDLKDLYNASMALNCIYTDFDLYMRMCEEFEEDTREAIQNLDVSVICDDETREHVEAFREKMLSLYDVKPSEVDQEVVSPYVYREELYEWLAQRYNLYGN